MTKLQPVQNLQPGHICYACDRKLAKAFVAETIDNQLIWVGADCASKISKAGTSGWQPPKGGPRLFIPRN